MHGHARDVALSVGNNVEDSIRGDGWGLCATLAPIKAGERDSEDREENDEYNGALHR
jgi:hypothetical protein